MPRQSPLEEGEHAGGDTDDDVMMIDEVEGNKGRSLGRRDVGRGRRSRSRLILETSSYLVHHNTLHMVLTCQVRKPREKRKTKEN